MAAPRFHDLTVARVNPEAAGAVSITFAVPDELQESFHFQPGQFLTLRTTIDGQEVRRNYSICSTSSKYSQHKQLEVGIRPMAASSSGSRARCTAWALRRGRASRRS